MFECDPTDICGVGVAAEPAIGGEVHAIVGGGIVRIRVPVFGRAIAEVDPAEVRGVGVSGEEGFIDSDAVPRIWAEVDLTGIGGVGVAVGGGNGGGSKSFAREDGAEQEETRECERLLSVEDFLGG